MTPAGEDSFFGINRIRVIETFVYYTNTSTGCIGRIPMTLETGRHDIGIVATGPAQIVIDDLPGHLDGLAISTDQTHAYVASYLDGHLHKVTIDSEGQGTSKVILENLDRPTGINIAPSPTDQNKSKLYVICCGEIEVAWFAAYKEDPWKAIRDLHSAVHATVVERVTQILQIC
ncbi:hypothetical protein F5Y16DRAFT_374684 [Xylariaceae sp. FL0255]|nr:hypothetical protein F5Y16DRAFT_374684 [Xylariaceae sp. FL0255]